MKIFWFGFISIILFFGVAGCSKPKVELETNDLDLATASGLPKAFLLKVKAEGGNIRQLEGLDNDGNQRMASGITIDVPEKKISKVVNRIKEEMPPGFIVFVSDRNYGIGGKADNVSILKASAISDVLRVMGTNGWNYRISPAMVTERIEKWEKRFGLILIGAGFDWFEAKFIRAPKDMMEFAKEVYQFCPDVVDQGTETVEALASEMKRTNTVYLWWD